MSGAQGPRVVGIAPGPPFERRTWSGASYHLFTALGRQADLVDVVDASVPPAVDFLAKAAAISPDRHRWRERNEFSPIRRAYSSRRGARRAAPHTRLPAAVLQVGAWYDVAARVRPPAGLRCSFHDSNLAMLLRWSDFVVDPEARHIRRTLAAERAVFDRLDVIFAMSEWLRRSMVEDFEQDPDKVLVVGSGVNLDQLPDQHPPPPGKSLLFVGFDFDRKGGDDLLAAFDLVRDHHPEAVLRIVGPDPRPDPPPGVEWLGPIARIGEGEQRFQRILRESAVFVMPSRYDPFPNAFLEAMAHSLACVGTRVCGIPEIIDEGVTGLLVEPGEVRGLAGALDELLAAPERAAQMGAAGRRRVADRFTWDHVTRRMVEEMRRRWGMSSSTWREPSQ
jgi:starch synthase